MPRVVSVYDVGGLINGFGVDLSALTLTLLDGGLLLGRVVCSTHEISFIDGKANLDLFESTDEHKVYSCRFSLVKLEGHEATIIDCAARVSKSQGLVGRWNSHGSLGRRGVRDRAFELKVVRAVEPTLAKQETGDTFEAAVPIAATASASDGDARELLLSGDAVDQNGNIYSTTLQAKLHADGTITGLSTEQGRQCRIAGSWSGSNVSYTLDFPINGTLTQYSYRGVLTADGRETLSGTWKYELRSAGDDELFGGFTFTSLKIAAIDIDEFVSGQYIFAGSATSDGGTRYESKLTLNLADDGSLTGKSEELSIVPQTCELQGSWDREEKMITYRMSYTNCNTGTYEYVGKLHGQQFLGRWVNPRASDRVSERGDFVFSLTEFRPADAQAAVAAIAKPSKCDVTSHDEAAKAEKTTNLVEPTAGSEGIPLEPGRYLLIGSATSDSGTKYDSKLSLHLAADGSLTGESEELSIAPQVCKLEGTWESKDKTITYKLFYDGGTYDYVGKLEGRKLIGRWLNRLATKYFDAERGDFEFDITSFTATAIESGETQKIAGDGNDAKKAEQ